VTCSFAVSDGRTFTEREREDALHEVQLVDRRSLTYRQVSTARSGRWRITKTYATDPARAAVLVDVVFESLTGRPYQLYVLYDPALSNGGDDDRGERAGDALVVFDDRNASALMTGPAPRKLSSGYLGASDGWTDLKDDHRMDWSYRSAAQARNVVQTALLPLTGVGASRRLTLALGFGGSHDAAVGAARGALPSGFAAAAAQQCFGLHEQRRVDRLVRDPHRRIIRVIEEKSAADLTRRPAPRQLVLYVLAQHAMLGELAPPRPYGPGHGQPVGTCRTVTVGAAVAPHLPRHRRHRAAELFGDRGQRLPLRQAAGDRLPLLEREP
jgi:hypothetical protein